MTCWEVLGIDPTNDRTAIDQAYQSQKKFASGDDLERLDAAYREATGEGSRSEPGPSAAPDTAASQASERRPATPAGLDAREAQVKREVVLQLEAMLNDRVRMQDVGIWRAILTDPPADRDAIREALSNELYPRLYPLIEKRELAPPVLHFLSEWFGWEELEQAAGEERRGVPDPMAGPSGYRDVSPEEDSDESQRPTLPSFWPAIVGWIVGLIVLTSLFSQITGS
ncbi:hypothetical protein C8D92_102152 [Tamilnaduibacter salinus]|uniref:Molecular chaperone DnaJ n=1 Tax=Tamilnaduibacter salinus TaxID=1484056 RepID=A0A2U1CZ96_9GAMM|nr:J domain-containing protein [Tamilnaduibacter salinus]PVY78116.1 hypothetical protein C8D92_102152 [Tamilnaduibacter salinus]